MERKPLVHTPEASDEVLAKEAQDFYAAHTALQVVAEAYVKVIEQDPGWMSAETQLQAFTLEERLGALVIRKDERVKLFEAFSKGLPSEVVREMPPVMQTQIIALALSTKVRTSLDVVRLFDPKLLVCYADAERTWRDLVSRIPWLDDSAPVKEFMLHVATSLLKSDRQDAGGSVLPPILDYHRFRTAIDYTAWQDSVPLKTRAAVDEARLAAESAKRLFTAEDEIKLIGLDALCRDLPTQFFRNVFVRATEKMGFDTGFIEAAKPLPSEKASDLGGPSKGQDPKG